jgi:hypothetical protein
MDKTDTNTANADATRKEAAQYWGYLIKKDKCGTETFDRLLKGIAAVIVSSDAHMLWLHGLISGY